MQSDVEELVSAKIGKIVSNFKKKAPPPPRWTQGERVYAAKEMGGEKVEGDDLDDDWGEQVEGDDPEDEGEFVERDDPEDEGREYVERDNSDDEDEGEYSGEKRRRGKGG